MMIELGLSAVAQSVGELQVGAGHLASAADAIAGDREETAALAEKRKPRFVAR